MQEFPTVPPRVRRARRGQSGVSLLEVLIATAVMGPLTLASVIGLQVQITSSASAQQSQELQVALTTATENLKAMPYLRCGTAEEYQKLYASWSEPLEASVRPDQLPPRPEIASVQYWQQGKSAYTPNCGDDGGAQQLVVVVAQDDEELTGSVVKRDASARKGAS